MISDRNPPRQRLVLDLIALVAIVVGVALVLGGSFAFDARVGLAATGVVVATFGIILGTDDGRE